MGSIEVISRKNNYCILYILQNVSRYSFYCFIITIFVDKLQNKQKYIFKRFKSNNTIITKFVNDKILILEKFVFTYRIF